MYLNVRFIILTRMTLTTFLFNWFIKNIGRGIYMNLMRIYIPIDLKTKKKLAQIFILSSEYCLYCKI